MALFNSFIFDTSKGETPQSIARKRAIAAQIMSQLGPRPARNVGEGLGNALASIGQGIAANVLNRRADEAERQGTEEAKNWWRDNIANAIMTGTPLPTSGFLGGVPAGDASDPISDRVARAHGDDKLTGDKQEFVSALLPHAIEESKRTGIDPRIIVAQAALETGWGRSAPGNNYFGIKSHGQGGGQTLATTEVINGRPVRVRDSFRTYASPADSVRGYGDFILQNPRYKALREAQGLDAQLEALGASGYATDPNYARKVGAIARGITIPDVATAYAPTGSPLPGALAAAPFPSAGLPTVPADAAPASDVIVATTPEEVLAAEEAMNSPEFVLPGQTAAPDGGRVVNPLDLPENQITLKYVDENGNPLPDQGDGGDPVVRQAPADTSIWGGGMDPNDPSTIPAMAGGTRDVLPNPVGYFPPAPTAQSVGFPPAPQPVQVAQAGGGLLSLPTNVILEGLANPFLPAEQKAALQEILNMQIQAQDPYRQAQIAKMQREAAGGNTTYGLNPIYGTDPKTGKTVLGVLGNDGTFKPVDTGGIEVSTGVEKVDLGTHYGLLDKRSGQMVGTLPKDNYGESYAKGLGGEEGKNAAAARADLPRIEDNAYTVVGIIDSLLNDPYLDKMVGPVRGRLPDITADAARVRSKLDQIHGQAFLQAFQMLRGGGTITEIEGQKATEAIARLNEAQSPEDYRTALNELRGIVMRGLERARRAAGLGSSNGASSSEDWVEVDGIKIRRKQ